MHFCIKTQQLWAVLLMIATSSTLASTHADTKEIIIKHDDSSLNRENAREKREQWEDQRALRKKINRSEELNFDKVNRRYTKEFDKLDHSFDVKDACLKSANINAYWEPSTLRCLNRRNGLPISP